MKGLKKVLLVAAVAVPFAAHAELKSIDDAMMSDVSGQSGLVIEAGFGTGPASVFAAHGAWANAGISIAAFKWEVDVEAWNSTTNDVIGNVPAAGPGTQTFGGFVAQNIQIAGAVDVTIDAVGDASVLGANLGAYASDPTALQGAGGIGITFANSDINFRVGDMGTYLAGVGETSSFGAIEIIGMNINGLELVVRGNGR